MDRSEILVFIPTYNERENVEKICSEINSIGLGLDILFMDDNSPDGTGAIIDLLTKKYKNVKAMHRPGKMGIGSAHLEGIRLAYDLGYKNLITMDGDFAHSPRCLSKFIESSKDHDIIIGSRYLTKNSLEGWNYLRKFLTLTGHFLTKYCLGIKYDATGALRLYRLDKIPRSAFDLTSSKGYSFFFESLYILSINGFSVKEIPIVLPPRIYGHSKMSSKEAFHSLKYLVQIYLGAIFNKKRYKIDKSALAIEKLTTTDIKSNWDEYWRSKDDVKGTVYDAVASFYRKFIIQPNLNYFSAKYFMPGAKLLHAGCGSGQVDTKINDKYSITALDNSIPALHIYKRYNADSGDIIDADIRSIPFRDGAFDGVYNLGVMEHFTEKEIEAILSEFYRILKPNGRLIIFWPPSFGISVIFLKSLRSVSKKLFGRDIKLHPDEITLIDSRKHVAGIFDRANFRIKEYYFGSRDLFTQMVIVAEKKSDFCDKRRCDHDVK